MKELYLSNTKQKSTGISPWMNASLLFLYHSGELGGAFVVLYPRAYARGTLTQVAQHIESLVMND